MRKQNMLIILLVCLVLTGCNHNKNEIYINEIQNITTQNLSKITIPYSKGVEEQIMNLLNGELPKEKQVLLKTCFIDTEKESFILETIYDSKELAAKVDSLGLFTVDNFNQFFSIVDFDPSPILFSPTELLDTKKGNCYAMTTLVMFFIDKYYPQITYEVITDKNIEGDAHIYLKLKSEKEELICDLTKDPKLILPRT